MSLRGKMQREATALFRTMQVAAKTGNVNKRGAFKGTQKVLGYVCNIHDSEDDELFGTVDVQEYDEDFEFADEGAGHHEGVLLSAVQDGNAGYFIVPELYSAVIISQDPVTFEEYIVSYSYVKKIRQITHESMEIGVSEIEPLGDELEGELSDQEKTGHNSTTKYEPLSIENKSTDGDSTTRIVQTPTSLELNINGTETVFNENGMEFGGDRYSAVLFNPLKSFLEKLLNTLGTTTTTEGAPLTTSQVFMAMKSELDLLESQIMKIGG